VLGVDLALPAVPKGRLDLFIVSYARAHFQGVFGTKGRIPEITLEIRDRLAPKDKQAAKNGWYGMA
jgi:hypothetical protein